MFGICPGEGICVAIRLPSPILNIELIGLKGQAQPCKSGVVVLETIQPFERAVVCLDKEWLPQEVHTKCMCG